MQPDVKITDRHSPIPENSYSHQMQCYNCSLHLYLDVRKGVSLEKIAANITLECPNCECNIFTGKSHGE
jgi:hypothetical protein